MCDVSELCSSSIGRHRYGVISQIFTQRHARGLVPSPRGLLPIFYVDHTCNPHLHVRSTIYFSTAWSASTPGNLVYGGSLLCSGLELLVTDRSLDSWLGIATPAFDYIREASPATTIYYSDHSNPASYSHSLHTLFFSHYFIQTY